MSLNDKPQQSGTPRTDALQHEYFGTQMLDGDDLGLITHARQLERELAEAQAQVLQRLHQFGAVVAEVSKQAPPALAVSIFAAAKASPVTPSHAAPMSNVMMGVPDGTIGSLSEFVHAPPEVREAIGADVAKRATERQQASIAASSTPRGTPFSATLKDHLWRMYKEGQISADHTAREVFDQMLDSLAQWLAQQPVMPSATAGRTDIEPFRDELLNLMGRWERGSLEVEVFAKKIEGVLKAIRSTERRNDA